MNVDNLCMRATFKKNDDSNTIKRQDFFGPFSIGELAVYLKDIDAILTKADFYARENKSTDLPMFTLEASVARQQEDEENLINETMESMIELNKMNPVYYDLWLNHWETEMPQKPSFLDFMDLINDGGVACLGDDIDRIIWKTLYDIGGERGQKLCKCIKKKKFVKNYLNKDNGVFHTDIGYFKFA